MSDNVWVAVQTLEKPTTLRQAIKSTTNNLMRNSRALLAKGLELELCSPSGPGRLALRVLGNMVKEGERN